MMNPQLGRLGSVSPSLLNGGSAKPTFRGDLVDFFTFKGKGNIDLDRNIIIGLLDNKLTAYNFVWNLMSGYGGYNDNYLTYSKAANVFVTDDHSITIMNFVPANNWVVFKYGNSALKSTKIKVIGLTSDDQLEYGYSPSNEGARVMMPIPKDGIYDLPESVVNQSTYNIGFFLRSALTKNVTIEQIPLYEGAIVTDGIDDYLKLDKVGYKVGTVIIKYKPVRLTNNWQYVLEAATDRTYITHNSVNGPVITNFDNYNTVGDYEVGIINTPRLIETPFYIGCKSNIKEFISMALYSIAIYSTALSEEDVQKEISEAFPKYEQLILNR